MYQILTPEGTLVGKVPKLPDKTLLDFYRWMILGRTFSDRALALQRQGRAGTFGPLNGQEAASVGMAAPLLQEDWLTGSYREMLAYLVKGVPIAAIFKYLRGYVSDTYPWEARCLPVQIVLGTQILHAVGMAMAIQYEDKPHVAMGVLGDGASSQGEFSEALNMAAVYNAPMIFVVQNNGWAISMPRSKQTKSEFIAQRGPAFGMPGYVVDGNDVLATYKVVSECVERARAGDGPSLIEAITYRLGGHSTADDPTKYRPEAELKEWLPRDPFIRYRKFLLSRNIMSEAEDTQLKEEIQAEVNAAADEVLALPPQDPGQLFDIVYQTPTPQQQQQRAQILAEWQQKG